MSTKRQMKEEAARREAELKAGQKFATMQISYIIVCALLACALLVGLFAGTFLLKNARSSKNIMTNLESYTPWPKEVRQEFQKMLVQNGGRVKPINTYSRFTLLQISNTTKVKFETKDGKKHKIAADEWLLDALFRNQIAKEIPVFNVDDTDVIVGLGVAPKEGSKRHRKRDRYSYNHLLTVRKKMSEESSELAKKKEKFDESDDDPDLALKKNEIQLLRLSRNVSLLEYMMGQFAVIRNGEDMVNDEIMPDYLQAMAQRFDMADFLEIMPPMTPQQLGGIITRKADSEEGQLIQASFQLFYFLASSGRNLDLFPPEDKLDGDWGSIGEGLFTAMQDKSKREWAKANINSISAIHKGQKAMFGALDQLDKDADKTAIAAIVNPMKETMAEFVQRQKVETNDRFKTRIADLESQIAAAMSAFLTAQKEKLGDQFSEKTRGFKGALKESGEGLEIFRLNQKISAEKPEAATTDREVKFYNSNRFLKSLIFFIFAFLVMAMSWLVPGSTFSKVTGWLAIGLTVLGLLFVVMGIAERCIIRHRPPITNLYDTVLFITAVAVFLSLLIELPTRIGVGKFLAVVIGVGGMFLAARYEVKEATDTMDPLQAVLDTNFWLWTHVTTINIGYAAGLLAMCLGIYYLLYRFLRPLPKVVNSLTGKSKLPNNEIFYEDKPTRDRLKMVTSMTYGIVCFCLIFSIIGTVLGGVWANYSWGRFWGWDPKENGALMICLWALVILHARMGGYIRNIGMAVNSVFLGMIVTFSWWGVNNLGIGLHSYGFTAGVWVALAISWAVSILIMICGIPLWLHERFKRQAKKEKNKKPVPDEDFSGEEAPA